MLIPFNIVPLVVLCGIGVPICTVSLQLVRERLVQALIVAKSPLSLLISDWSIALGGYTGVFDRKTLWGIYASEILLVKSARRLFITARVLDGARSTFMVVFAFGAAFEIWRNWLALAISVCCLAKSHSQRIRSSHQPACPARS